MKLKRTHVVAVILGAVLVGAFATVAIASPPFGFTPTNLVTANLDDRVNINSDRIKLKTKGPTDIRVQRVVVNPGGYSGWHHHPGLVIVAVESGAVTVTHSDCSSRSYGPGLPNGSVFVESGDDPGQVSSVNGATLYATYIAPNDAGFRIEDPVQSCP